MPNAPGHDLITVATGLIMLPPAYGMFAAADPEQAPLRAGILFGAHLISGMLFSPDLDLDSAIDDRWGMFRWIWAPYTYVMPHRHFWSHGLILPPLLRLAYFIAVVMLTLIVTARGLAVAGIVVPDYHARLADALVGLVSARPRETLIFLLGFITGGAVHTIADWLVTGGKRYLRMLGFRTRRSYDQHDHAIHRMRSW
jgi:uncharacterized metal-binding protein